MHRVVAAVGAADGVGAADVAAFGPQAVVAAFAVDPADRMDRREIQHVEAHRADCGQAFDNRSERAVDRGSCVAERGKQLIPTGEFRRRPIGAHRVDGAAGGERAVDRPAAWRH